jgi:hypothetical protein
MRPGGFPESAGPGGGSNRAPRVRRPRARGDNVPSRSASSIVLRRPARRQARRSRPLSVAVAASSAVARAAVSSGVMTPAGGRRARWAR